MFKTKVANASVYYEEVIPDDLLNLIIKEVENIDGNNFSNATIGDFGNFNLETKIRNSKVSWWYEHNWVCSIFSHYFNKANRELWEYDLTYLDSIQVTSYDVGQHYGWHSDYGFTEDSNHTRKLSASLLITDPSEYDGGGLEFIDYHGKTLEPPKGKGTIIIFDSRIPHRVLPVTRGKRISLVTWMLGPKLR